MKEGMDKETKSYLKNCNKMHMVKEQSLKPCQGAPNIFLKRTEWVLGMLFSVLLLRLFPPIHHFLKLYM